MAKLVFFAAVLAVLLAHSAAEGDNILQLPSAAKGESIPQLPCQLQLQQTSLDACRRVVDQQLATQRPFFLSPQALATNWVQAQCCQQLRDISRECRAAAIRQIVRYYEQQGWEQQQHQQEQGSFQPSKTFPPQQGQGWYLPGQTFPQQQGQGWYLPGQTFPQQQGQGWYLPGQTFPQQQGQGWYLPGQTFPQQQGQGWYLPGQTFPQQQGQGWYLPGQTSPQQQPGSYCPSQTFPQQQQPGSYRPSQTFPHQQQQGGGFGDESTTQQQQQKPFGSTGQGKPVAGHESSGEAAQHHEQGPSSTSETFPPQQQGERSFGESTTKQQKGSQDPSHMHNDIYRQGVQPTQHILGETVPEQEVQGQYCGKQSQTGFGGSSSPSLSGTDQQAARLRIQLEVVARARQVAAQLPAMCRLEGQSALG
ncbi:hypothetical protein ACQ4PT_044287 [Festuca glaucescens]